MEWYGMRERLWTLLNLILELQSFEREESPRSGQSHLCLEPSWKQLHSWLVMSPWWLKSLPLISCDREIQSYIDDIIPKLVLSPTAKSWQSSTSIMLNPTLSWPPSANQTRPLTIPHLWVTFPLKSPCIKEFPASHVTELQKIQVEEFHRFSFQNRMSLDPVCRCLSL